MKLLQWGLNPCSAVKQSASFYCLMKAEIWGKELNGISFTPISVWVCGVLLRGLSSLLVNFHLDTCCTNSKVLEVY